jgi:hypothetical protein
MNAELSLSPLIQKKRTLVLYKIKYESNVSLCHSFKSLDELNENGFTYDFNLHEQDIAKNRKNMRLNTFTAMKEILILEMKQSFMVSNQIRKKKFCRRFCCKFY